MQKRTNHVRKRQQRSQMPSLRRNNGHANRRKSKNHGQSTRSAGIKKDLILIFLISIISGNLLKTNLTNHINSINSLVKIHKAEPLYKL